MIRRINFFGGPGSGKSTLATGVYHALKIKNCSVELVQEYVKEWAYEKRKISPYDEVFLFGKQMRLEELRLRNGVDLVVTDCPIHLPIVYAQLYGFKRWELLFGLTSDFDAEYPPLNFIIKRNDDHFKQEGRYQNLGESKNIDSLIESYLRLSGLPHLYCGADDLDATMEIIMTKLRGD